MKWRKPGELNAIPEGTHRLAAGLGTTANSCFQDVRGGRWRSRSSDPCGFALSSKQAWRPGQFTVQCEQNTRAESMGVGPRTRGCHPLSRRRRVHTRVALRGLVREEKRVARARRVGCEGRESNPHLRPRGPALSQLSYIPEMVETITQSIRPAAAEGGGPDPQTLSGSHCFRNRPGALPVHHPKKHGTQEGIRTPNDRV